MSLAASPSALLIAMCVLSYAIAYFVCGIPSGLVVAKRMGHVDVRTTGSGNVGSTNVARTVGKKAGALTLLLDVLKAAVSVLIGYVLIGLVGAGSLSLVTPGAQWDWMMALVYAFCIAGHVFSPYLHFHGGKGIAVGFGGAVALMPLVGLSLWIPFLLFALTTKRVSAGSVAAAISLPFLTWAIVRPSTAYVAVIACVAVIVVWAHRANIVKLIHGQEAPFSFKHTDGKGGAR